ncbi:hypothetical protein MRX96_007481 [Rhipicephalus microplus]
MHWCAPIIGRGAGTTFRNRSHGQGLFVRFTRKLDFAKEKKLALPPRPSSSGGQPSGSHGGRRPARSRAHTSSAACAAFAAARPTSDYAACSRACKLGYVVHGAPRPSPIGPVVVKSDRHNRRRCRERSGGSIAGESGPDPTLAHRPGAHHTVRREPNSTKQCVDQPPERLQYLEPSSSSAAMLAPSKVGFRISVAAS